MNKVYIQNLCMVVTNKCNLDCAHCLRGVKDDKSMSKDTIEATLNQVMGIGNLCICGGEPTLALETIEYIFKYIVDNKILLETVSITINGTRYSLELLRLLDYINSYIYSIFSRDGIILGISYDEYHINELKRLNQLNDYIENVRRYSKFKHFYELRRLNPKLKLFREGNAVNIDSNLTIELRPIDVLITYANKKGVLNNNGLCNIGPLIAVNVDGIITEENSSLEHQQTLYNYGNVSTDSFEEVALARGRILAPKKWNKESSKVIKKYMSYNK